MSQSLGRLAKKRSEVYPDCERLDDLIRDTKTLKANILKRVNSADPGAPVEGLGVPKRQARASRSSPRSRRVSPKEMEEDVRFSKRHFATGREAVKFLKDKDYIQAIQAVGFCTRQLKKPIGRNKYLSDYLPYKHAGTNKMVDPVVDLIEDKKDLALFLATRGDDLVGISIGAPMRHPFDSRRKWSSVTLLDLPSSAVTAPKKTKKKTLYQGYQRIVPAGHLNARGILDGKVVKDPYELVLICTRTGAADREVGAHLMEDLKTYAISKNFRYLLAEAAASSSNLTVQLIQKVYLKRGFHPLAIEVDSSGERLKGAGGEYLLVGMDL